LHIISDAEGIGRCQITKDMRTNKEFFVLDPSREQIDVYALVLEQVGFLLQTSFRLKSALSRERVFDPRPLFSCLGARGCWK